MLKMKPYVPPDRIAIRDSIDEEISDDIEDDVFIRDGKLEKVRNLNFFNVYFKIKIIFNFFNEFIFGFFLD